MAFSSGTYSLIYDFETIAASADPRIRSTHVQAEFEGIATGLSLCILKDGSQTVTADIPFGGNKLTGVGDPTSAQDAATKTYVDNKTWGTANYIDSSVTSAKLATDSVPRVKIVDNAVSNEKLDTMAQYHVKGRIASGTGDVQDLDADDIGTILGQASASITLPVNVVSNTYDTGSASGVGYQCATTGVFRVQRASGAADTDAVFTAHRGTGLVAQIEANGDFESATNSYGATSDRSVKREIDDMDYCLSGLMSLPLRKGKLNIEYAEKGASAPVREFVVADELESAGFSDLVKERADGLKSVNYSGLYFKSLMGLQEAVTEYRAEIADLKTRIAALEKA